MRLIMLVFRVFFLSPSFLDRAEVEVGAVLRLRLTNYTNKDLKSTSTLKLLTLNAPIVFHCNSDQFLSHAKLVNWGSSFVAKLVH